MKRQLIILKLIFISHMLLGQIFQEVAVPFEGVSFSAVSFSDIDGDDDQDILITGVNKSIQPISKLYRNDGSGNFTEDLNSIIEGVSSGAIAFADVDGDNDEDVMVTGNNNIGAKVAKLYMNNGSGIFTEDLNTFFEGVSQSSVAFADIDNDGDKDLLINGLFQSNSGKAKLYLNDGSGIFEQVEETPLIGLRGGSISFSDTDGDDDEDVLITGRRVFSQDQTSILYLNDGGGNFTESTNNFIQVSESSAGFSDIDGDGDQDLLITGSYNSGQISRMYINAGNGSFTEDVESSFPDVNFSAIAFSDIDGDNDQDVIITGETGAFEKISAIYLNDGEGQFIENNSSIIEGVYAGSVAFSDVDGDEDPDLLVCGYSESGNHTSKLYLNIGTTSSAEIDQNNQNFKIFPNPSNPGSIALSSDFEYYLDNIQIKLFNNSGKEFKGFYHLYKSKENEIILNTTNLAKGNYFLKIDFENKSETLKFVIQ